ncbi:MAG TPA: hypothetical protein VFG42_10245 [Baekduia sp.]|uniref:hypothetical protein n=1 Tax=Baekduia sp. TaxID=2600305 RepID=UPI002D78DD4B|nr:hypothetical protein [Baekduia sp.]HET6507161.1 hypothetical protein [Baekduia sp.]
MSEEPLNDDEHAAWWEAHGEEELRELLFWRWDPIGVASAFPDTWDEYDPYAPRVVAVLRAGGEADAVAAELAAIALEVMGIAAPEPAERAAPAIVGWYRESTTAWATRGEHRSSRWRAVAGGRRPTRVVALTDPEPPPLDGATPTIGLDADDEVTLDWPGATLTLTGVVATSVGPSRPLGAARPGVVSEVLDSPWIALLTAIRRADLGPVRHVVLPLGNGRFVECVCAGVALS